MDLQVVDHHLEVLQGVQDLGLEQKQLGHDRKAEAQELGDARME